MKIKRTINNQEVEITLTDAEILSMYDEARRLSTQGWISSLLEEYEYPEQTPEVVARITDVYLKQLDRCALPGEFEHDVFEYTMDHDFTDIKKVEEE